MGRSRRELSEAYVLAKFGFDRAENEPAKNLQNFVNFPNFANESSGATRGQLQLRPRDLRLLPVPVGAHRHPAPPVVPSPPPRVRGVRIGGIIDDGSKPRFF